MRFILETKLELSLRWYKDIELIVASIVEHIIVI